MVKNHEPPDVLSSDKREYVFRRWIRLKNGRVIYASEYGLKAFKIPVS